MLIKFTQIRKTFIVSLLACSCSMAFADSKATISTKKHQLQQINQQIQQVSTVLTQDKHQVGQLQSNLRTTEISIGDLNKNLAEIDQNLAQQQQILRKLTTKQKSYQTLLLFQQNTLAHQIRTIYTMGDQNTIKFLLNQEDASEISRMWHYYQYILQARNDMIQKINVTINDIVTNEQQIATHNQQLNELKAQQNEKRLALQQNSQQRQEIIKQLQSSIQTNQQQLVQLLENKKALAQLIIELQSQPMIPVLPKVPFPDLKGKLPWPLSQGKIVSSFDTPIDNSEVHLNGVIIKAPNGTKVYAIAPGKVVFADWLRGFGLLLIIDHGNGYMSLYGYDQSLYKKTGDNVKPGDLIATVGDSGGQHIDALYFAIRYNGKPVDPVAWMTRSNKSFA